VSHGLSEFLIELSIAIHQHAMYPPGHPSLEPAAMHVTDRVTYLLKEKGTLSLGAAKDQLVIEGVGTDVNNPLLRELAGRLLRHHLGAISFHQSVSKQEILQFLTLMAEEPDLTDQPLGLAPRERREQQPNIHIHPVAYDSLRLLDDDGAVEEDEEGRTARTRYAQLWVGLAKTAVVRAGRDEQSPDEEVRGGPEDVSRDPAAVARAISEHSESHTYDQMIVGYLLQIVQELRVASGPDAVQLNQRMGKLVAAMEPDALSGLLHMGGDSGQRHQFLMNASRGLKGESVLRSLTVAMHGDRQMMLPLLQFRQFDEYTTTHSLNVSVLSMGLAEWLGLGGRDVRVVGVAGLLHDLGKVTIPKEILNKPGTFDDREREIMNSHPVEGARMILSSDQQLDLAAAVAYEHHIMIDGGGYPSLRYPRDCHVASKLVHVCDVYDALRTKRPCRDPWPAKAVLTYIKERSGTEFDEALAHAFTSMMGEWEPRLSTLHGEETPPATQHSPAPTDQDLWTPDGPSE
jgi:putative nucleotidyltransferase with HDIG domain